MMTEESITMRVWSRVEHHAVGIERKDIGLHLIARQEIEIHSRRRQGPLGVETKRTAGEAIAARCRA